MIRVSERPKEGRVSKEGSRRELEQLEKENRENGEGSIAQVTQGGW